MTTYHDHGRSTPPRSEPGREVELKLAVPETSVDALTEHLRRRASATRDVRQRHEVTTYFDTPDQMLAQGGMSLRVRTDEGRRVQTLKADSRVGLAADRAEWEWPVEHDTPDLSLLEATPAGDLLPRGLDLEPVFSTEIDRTSCILELDGGTVVEAAYDEGRIQTEGGHQVVRELELELRDGDAAPVYWLAADLHAAAPLRFESESKAARGYRLKTGAKPGALKAKDVPLDRHVSAADAFRQVLNAELGHLLANQPAALAGDPEGVHQMRVAIRRLRAILMLFQPHLEPHAASCFQNELRRLGRVFGEARDWDVFCLQILPHAVAHAGWRDLLLRPATAARTAAYQGLVRELHGLAFTGLVLGLAASAAEACLLSESARRQRLEDLCPDLLDRLARKVERRGRHVGHRSDAERHALRKSLKKLRYAIDFVSPVLPSKFAKPYLHHCKKLQQTLGDMNDGVTALTLAERLIDETHFELVPAVGVLADHLGRRHADALDELAKYWKAFAAQPRFWV